MPETLLNLKHAEYEPNSGHRTKPELAERNRELDQEVPRTESLPPDPWLACQAYDVTDVDFAKLTSRLLQLFAPDAYLQPLLRPNSPFVSFIQLASSSLFHRLRRGGPRRHDSCTHCACRQSPSAIHQPHIHLGNRLHVPTCSSRRSLPIMATGAIGVGTRAPASSAWTGQPGIKGQSESIRMAYLTASIVGVQ
ncbi:hypothetical protein BKA80DRAFT_11906 [Phyllosticta citrichinensis]